MKRICLALALLAVSSSATAAGRQLTTVWMVGDSLVADGTRDVARLDHVLKHRLLPAGLAELTSGSADASQGLAAGTQLVEIQSAGALVFCDPGIRGQKLVGHAQPCLVDADKDGSFEGVFWTTSVTKGMLTVQGKMPKKPKAIGPLSYRRLDPGQFKGELFVGLQYRGDANLFSNQVFEVKYGSEEKTGSLTERIVHKKSNIPGSTEFMGGRFTILSATPTGIRIRLEQPVPAQPFGVFQTTTYRIY